MAGRSHRLKDHWQEHRLFLSRVIGAAVIVVLLTGALVWRLVHLQVFEYERFSGLSEGNQIRVEPLPPTRGLILDRAGRILAENIPSWQLVAVPEQLDDFEATLARLEAEGLVDPVNHAELVELVRTQRRRVERVTLTNLNEEQAATFAVQRYAFPGIDIRVGLIRDYPYREAAAHVVGYVGRISESDQERIDTADYQGTSQIGKTGLERAYEDVLHGTVGYEEIVVNAHGRPSLETVPPGGLERQLPVPGEHVVTSIDMRLQLAAQQALADFRGAVVVIDPRNGDVLALVSTPGYDANGLASGMSQSDYHAISTDPDEPFVNRAIGKPYNPGSTIKPFLGLAGLYYDSDYVGETHFCNGQFRLPNSSRVYREPARVNPHGETTLYSAIVRSCNVYFYGLGVDLEIDRMEPFMEAFGFGTRTGIDISGESAGLMPGREWKQSAFRAREDQTWYLGETVSASIGQGYVEFTPLQLAAATGALATNGQRFRPRLLTGTEDAETSEVIAVPPVALDPIAGIEADDWLAIHGAMVGVTVDERGTGRAAMDGATYSVAGKTGTAQVIGVAQNARYDAEELEERLRDNGLFIGYAPAENPELAIAVVVENNGGGGATAAPIARKVFDAWFTTEEQIVELASN
jgi:penicillin-binding protein 2